MSLDGIDIIPFMGLTSWVAFRQGPHHAILMGDIVVFEDEIKDAMAAAIQSGLYVTALHNHFVREQPRTMFMHIEGTDGPALASGAHGVFDAIKNVRYRRRVEPAAEKVSSLSIRSVLRRSSGTRAKEKMGVFKFVLGRPSVPLVCSRCGNLGIDAAMGYNTWAAFQGTSERTAVCGDLRCWKKKCAQ